MTFALPSFLAFIVSFILSPSQLLPHLTEHTAGFEMSYTTFLSPFTAIVTVLDLPADVLTVLLLVEIKLFLTVILHLRFF